MRTMGMMAMVTLLLASTAFAQQWGWLEAPMKGQVTSMERLPSGGILLGTSGGLFASTDGGASWFFTGLGSLDDPNAGNDVHFDAFEDEDGRVFVAMENLYEGTTALNDFELRPLANPAYGIESIERYGDTWVLASALEIWRSTDDLASFTPVFDDSNLWDDIVGLHTNPIDGTFIAHMERAGGIWLLVSSDDGVTWVEQQIVGVFGDLEPPVFAPDGRLYFAHNYQNQGYVRYSDDYGATSTLVYTADTNHELGTLVYGGDSNFAALRYPGIVVSEDMGSTWSFENDPAFIPLALAYDGNTLLAGCEDGVRSTTNFTDWSFTHDGLAALDLAGAELTSNGDAFVVNSGLAWMLHDGTWSPITSLEDANALYTVAHETASGRLIVMGRSNSGGDAIISYSDDNGATWTAATGFTGGSYGDFENVITLSDGTLLTGHANLGILQSSDEGATWSTLNSDVSGYLAVTADGTLYSLLWGTLSRSTDGGASWTTESDLFGVEDVATSPISNTVVAVDFTTTSIRNDDGTWSDLYNAIWPVIPNQYYNGGKGVAFASDGTLHLAISTQSQITGRRSTTMLSSTDDGVTFTADDGWSNIQFAEINRLEPAASGDVLALTNMGVYVSGFTADVTDPADVVTTPATFSLAQNYPNPFNPTTTISFGLDTPGQATLIVYDLLGREVARLIDGRLSAGQHTAQLDASRWSSGVYLYQLQSGSQQQVRRMTLVK